MRTVGPYRIERELARGGMGVVSIAVHTTLGRRVALKELLAAGRAQAHERDRFLREAQALAKLNHPGIVRVYESGQSERGLFLVMDLVEGQSLDQRLANGPLDPREAARLIEAVAQAIQFAHDQGILHRDIKPANILVGADGRPRLTDFGLARDAEQEAQRLTQTGELLGTPAYMPPEQASGEKDLVDTRADIYSLGATLYTLVSGQPPYRGQTPMNVVTQVISKPAPRLRATRPDAPADLETIVTKCMEKERAHRYRTARVLAEDLARFVAGDPIRATPPSLGRRLGAWGKRHRLLLGAVTVGLLLLAVALPLALSQDTPAAKGALALEPEATTRRWPLVIEGRVRSDEFVRVFAEHEGRPLKPEGWAVEDGGFSLRLRPTGAPQQASFELYAETDDGRRSAPFTLRATLDDEPPQLSFDPWDGDTAGYPQLTLRGTLSEPATIRIGEQAFPRSAGRFELELNAQALDLRRLDTCSATDRAGWTTDAELPFLVLTPNTKVEEALAELPAGKTVYFTPGVYRLSLTLRRSIRLLGADGVTLVAGEASSGRRGQRIARPLITVDLEDPGPVQLVNLRFAAEEEQELDAARLAKEANLDTGSQGIAEGKHGDPQGLLHVQRGQVELSDCRFDPQGLGNSIVVHPLRQGLANLIVGGACEIVHYDLAALRVMTTGQATVVGALFRSTLEEEGAKEEQRLQSLTQRFGNREVEDRNGVVELRGQARARLDGVTIRGTFCQGVRLEGQSQIEILGSTISENREEGIRLGGESKATLKDTLIEGNAHDGVMVEHCAWVELTGCRILRNGLQAGDGQCGVRLRLGDIEDEYPRWREALQLPLHERRPSRLVDCRIEGNGRKAGVDVREHRLLLQRCVIRGNRTKMAVYLNNDSRVELVDSEVSDNTGHAIAYDEGAQAKLRATRIHGNAGLFAIHGDAGLFARTSRDAPERLPIEIDEACDIRD